MSLLAIVFFFEITSALAQKAGQREVGGYTKWCRWHGHLWAQL